MRGNGKRGGYSRKRRGGDSDKSQYLSGRKERVSLESGRLVLLDQFMLANSRFYESIKKCVDNDEEIDDEIIYRYGGIILDVPNGIYRLERDPIREFICVFPEESKKNIEDEEKVGKVYLNTRCLALFDKEILDDLALLKRYREIWIQGDDKGCRDLLRDNGGAVRYGFSKISDDFIVSMKGGKVIVTKVKDEEIVAKSENKSSDGAKEISTETEEDSD